MIKKTFIINGVSRTMLVDEKETLAATIGEEAVTLEDVYEPYLMQLGFLTRTPRGRCVTMPAYEHLGIPYQGQMSLGL